MKTTFIALDKFKPYYFLYENNKSMSKSIRDEITKRFCFEPICINSAKLSAQNRHRLYWCGRINQDGTYSRVEVKQPTDRGIMLRDILDTGVSWREKRVYAESELLQGECGKCDGWRTFPAPMAAGPFRIGTIESDARNQEEHDSNQYRVYSPDGKSVTMCGQGRRCGSKDGIVCDAIPSS